jgi:hypothetical protein
MHETSMSIFNNSMSLEKDEPHVLHPFQVLHLLRARPTFCQQGPNALLALAGGFRLIFAGPVEDHFEVTLILGWAGWSK